ncbi:EF-hand calcium-binding domain-containing protein 1 [Mactra antiquata]
MSSKRQEQAKIIEKLSKRKDKARGCHFKKHEIEKLLTMYDKHLEGSLNVKKLDRLRFRDILHDMFGMTDDMLLDRVFRAFDRDNDNYINEDEWVMGLSVFLNGQLEEKVRYCFNVYDLNQDGFISREEMYQLLKHCLVKQPTDEDPEEGIKDMVEMCLKKMDLDHDSRLSYSDYAKSVEMEPLLLEAFGRCLPEPDKCHCFMNLISDEYTKY